MTTSQILQLAISLLPMVQTGVTEFVGWIHSLRSAAQQAGEWSDAQETAFRSALFAKTNDPAYAPDSQ